MDSIYILGAGGLAKEVWALIRATGSFDVVGFIDVIAKSPISISGTDIPVIAEKDFFSKKFITLPKLAVGIGSPEIISALVEKFKKYDFPNLIHPSATIDRENVSYGKGNVIYPGVVITTAVRFGDFNILNPNVTIGHDSTIGNGNVFAPAVNISGTVEIGDFNFFGVNSVVLQNRKVGNNNVIGASSLVLYDLPNRKKVVGIPGKEI